MPRELRIGCYTYRVEISEIADSMAGAEFGHMNIINQKIRLMKGMSRQKLANTFLHEVLHAIHWVYGLWAENSDEEAFTCQTANGMCAFWQDNPAAMRWLQELLLNERGSA